MHSLLRGDEHAQLHPKYTVAVTVGVLLVAPKNPINGLMDGPQSAHSSIGLDTIKGQMPDGACWLAAARSENLSCLRYFLPDKSPRQFRSVGGHPPANLPPRVLCRVDVAIPFPIIF